MGDRRIVLSIAFYGLLAAAALGIAVARGASLLETAAWAPWAGAPGWAPHAASLAGGLALALLTVGLTRVLVSRTRWARALHVELRRALGPLPVPTAVAFAVTSGLGEELLFRGALQPWIGYPLASVLFGVVHIGPNRRYWPWTAWAVVMGFLFGAVHGVSGWLWGAVLAHVGINYVNLRYLAAHDPEGDDRHLRPPPLLAAKKRPARF